MNTSTRNMLGWLAEMGWKLSMGIGAMLFLIGGEALHRIASVSRGLAEVEGLGLAFLCLFFGFLLKKTDEYLQVAVEKAGSEVGSSSDSSDGGFIPGA